MRQSSRIDVYTYWYVQLTAEHIFFSYIWVGVNLVNLPLRSSERLHREKQTKTTCLRIVVKTHPSPPTKIHIILLGGMKLWIIHLSRCLVNLFRRILLFHSQTSFFCTGKASYLDDKALSFLNSSNR